MITRRTLVRWLWGVPVGVGALFVGQMLGVALATALGLELPPSPVPVDEGTQILLFLPAAIAVAMALAGMAVGLTGRWWQRWAILAAFIYGAYGVGNAIESSVFTTIGGEVALAVWHLPQSILGALAVVLMFPAPSDEGFRESVVAFLPRWKPETLAARLGLAVLAFPVIYFLFGLIASPILTPHYEGLDFLILPPLATMLKVVAIRSVLLLLVSLPIIAGWRRSRASLVLALGFGHFVAVGFAGLVQAPFFPAALRWTHGVEILADSMCYAAVLAWLFFPRRYRAREQPPVLHERLA